MGQREPAGHAIHLPGQPDDPVDVARVTQPHRVVRGLQRNRRLPATLRCASRLSDRADSPLPVALGQPRPRARQRKLGCEQRRLHPVPRFGVAERLGGAGGLTPLAQRVGRRINASDPHE